MSKIEKEQLLAEIERMISYGKEEPTINPELLKYLDIESLKNMHAKLKKKTATLKEEDKLWLQQFKKDEGLRKLKKK